MGWLKRNLVFVIVGVATVLAMGGASFFIWQGWSRNSEASGLLNENYAKLQEVASSPQQPGTNNTQLAKEQEKQMLGWIASVGQYFRNIPAIPPGATVSSAAYADALRQTIDQLQHEAESASVTLPPKYDFSFSAQRSLLRFAPGSLEPLAQQLGEVKAISEILFAARVNDLDSIQRVRVSDDDMQGLQSDYIDEHPMTNDLAILTPYVVNFRSFTPELARVVTGFATSPHPFIVKSITVQPASGAMTPDASGAMPTPYQMNPDAARYRMQPTMANPDQPQPVPAVTGKGGLQTVLKEQLLHITLEVEIVKLLPKS